jgi:hypothetical protein
MGRSKIMESNKKANDFANALQKKERFKKELSTVKNLEDFFIVCGKYYDLKGTELGVISKNILISKIDSIIIATGAKLK